MGLGAAVVLRAPDGAIALGRDSAALANWLRVGGSRFFSDLAALRRLGALYLSAHPEEGSRARLSQLLMSGAQATVAARLVSAISRDWVSHQVVAVDGWLMARTEARLCAYLHLEERATS